MARKGRGKSKRRSPLPGKYAAIGYVTSKLVFPLMRRQAKRSAKLAAVGAARAGAQKVTGKPVHASLAVGSAVGAVGYLIMRKSGHTAAGVAKSAASKAADAVPHRKSEN